MDSRELIEIQTSKHEKGSILRFPLHELPIPESIDYDSKALKIEISSKEEKANIVRLLILGATACVIGVVFNKIKLS